MPLDPKDPFFEGALREVVRQEIGTLPMLVRQLQAGAEDEAWITPTLQNSWVAYSGTDSQPGYYKDGGGVVHLRGVVKNGSSPVAAIFTLPAGYRPAYLGAFPGVSDGGTLAHIAVTAGGVINAPSGGSTTWTSIDGITFRAEA